MLLSRRPHPLVVEIKVTSKDILRNKLAERSICRTIIGMIGMPDGAGFSGLEFGF